LEGQIWRRGIELKCKESASVDPDLLLLRQYARRGDQRAFEEVVRRHVDVVFSAAMRQVGDQHRAEEVTQAVFVLLAKKAGTLGDRSLVGGWLVNAARLVCKSLLRSERRRAHYERQAAAMRCEAQLDQAKQVQINTMIDEAMSKLDQTSRGLLVMQFMQGYSGREIAAVVGMSEDAVRKRISRALSELRHVFLKRGVTVSSEVLGAGLVGMKMSAPAGLASTSAAAVGGSGTAVTLAHGAAVAMAVTKAQAIAACIVAAVLITGAGIGIKVVAAQGNAPAVPTPSTQPTVVVAAGSQVELIRGTVIGPDDKPVSGAEILIGRANRRVDVYSPPRKGIDATTDAAGAFSVTKPEGLCAVVVRAPAGFAEFSGQHMSNDGKIKLAPWGSVEGTVLSAGKPVPRAQVLLWRIEGRQNPLRELVSHQTSMKTDAAGHFIFPRVAPGEAWMRHEQPGRAGRLFPWLYLQVEATKKAEVSITDEVGSDAQDHAVVGRVEVPAAIAPLVVWGETDRLSYEASIRLESADEATHPPGETPEQYKALEEAYGRTPAGKLAKEWILGRYFEVHSDGTFRIDALPPGKFDLSIRNFELLKEVKFNEDVAGAEKQFEIAETEPNDLPIDLGTITLSARRLLRAGDQAPDFTVTTLDGSQWKLADHQGKPVVLLMWGAYNSWQDEMKQWSQFVRKWNTDSRISLIGLFVAEDDAKAALYMRQYEFTSFFAQCKDGGTVMNLYENSWPSAVLIGSDGKIVQKHLNPKLAEELLNKALAK
jgi:RNA polymerase sigma factor (sigma-70 family)